jgi:lipoprotein-anchoring transpeptidase ErfK/SrfK
LRAYRSLIAIAVVIGVMLAGAGAIYAYDHHHRDVIAKGVTVAGIDVGGLKAAEARSRLQRRYEQRLRRPVVASFHGQRFTLSPADARVKVDIDAAVAEALHRSQGGSIFSRTWRSATGGHVDANVKPRVHYSQAAVGRLVDHARRSLDQAPRDASISFSSSSIAKVPEHAGRHVDAAALTESLRSALQRPAARHRIPVPVETVAPRVTTDSLGRKYPSAVTIDRGAFTLRVYQHLKLSRSYPIAVGMQGLETPAGLYHVQNKVVDPVWNVPTSAWAGSLAGQVIPPGPSNPLKARWMGLWNGAGIHGTDETSSIGHAFSHGCVRMLVPDVIDLYERVNVGTPVYIGD